MDRFKGWFGRSGGSAKPTDATGTLDLNSVDNGATSSGSDASTSSATEAAMQATAAAAVAAAAADQAATSSSSASSSGVNTADAGAAPEASSSPEPEEPESVNPMMQTSLTKRFRGRIQPMQMPTYESMMQEDFMNNCAVRSTIAGGMGGMLGVAFGIFTASLDTQVRCTAVNARERRLNPATCATQDTCWAVQHHAFCVYHVPNTLIQRVVRYFTLLCSSSVAHDAPPQRSQLSSPCSWTQVCCGVPYTSHCAITRSDVWAMTSYTVLQLYCTVLCCRVLMPPLWVRPSPRARHCVRRGC
jgi:hypothetical protein